MPGRPSSESLVRIVTSSGSARPLASSVTVPVPERDSFLSWRGTDVSNPFPSTGESAQHPACTFGWGATNFSLTSYCAAESLGVRPHRRRLEIKRRTLRPLDGTQPAREIFGQRSGPIKAATPDHDRRRTSSFDIDLHPPIKSSGVPAASSVASRSFASDPLASDAAVT